MEHPKHTKLDVLDYMLNVTTKNYLDWITGSGTSHISLIGIGAGDISLSAGKL